MLPVFFESFKIVFAQAQPVSELNTHMWGYTYMHVLLLLLLVRAKTPVIVNWRRLRWGLHHISPVNGNFPESHPGVYPVAVTEVLRSSI